MNELKYENAFNNYLVAQSNLNDYFKKHNKECPKLLKKFIKASRAKVRASKAR